MKPNFSLISVFEFLEIECLYYANIDLNYVFLSLCLSSDNSLITYLHISAYEIVHILYLLYIHLVIV